MNTAIVTYQGKLFDYRYISTAEIDIEDIAHSLSMQCRYRGHTRKFYSVADHSVRVSKICMTDPLAALLHDAAEAYIGDIPSPQKGELGWYHRIYHTYYHTSFRSVEKAVMVRIGECLGIPRLMERIDSMEVHAADKCMMATEIRVLMPSHKEFDAWVRDTTSRSSLPYILSPQEAEKAFMARYMILKDDRR